MEFQPMMVFELPEWEKEAAELAMRKHWDQVDKSGEPYHFHPSRVAHKVRESGGSNDQIVAAHLHDIVEDTDVTLADVKDRFGTNVAVIVDALTHRKNEPNRLYIGRIKDLPEAVLVKVCDIYDNLDPVRLSKIDKDTQERLLTKYGNALSQLAYVAK